MMTTAAEPTVTPKPTGWGGRLYYAFLVAFLVFVFVPAIPLMAEGIAGGFAIITAWWASLLFGAPA